ncbi:MAG: GNAT family protein [Candidatus Cloacimonadaceae bacterium]|nr:GNAT family protein [Candidatus Cloacimonadaceae bacterium]
MKKVVSKDGCMYSLERLYDDPALIKQFYLWQINEAEKDHFCFEPVVAEKEEYTDEGWVTFLGGFDKIVKRSFYFMLKNTTINEYLGWICLGNFNMRNFCADLSFYFPTENRHKGYGTIIIDLCLAMVFDKEFFWPLHKLYAETGSFNTSSIRLLEKSGFILDGKIRDHYWLGNEKYDQYIYTLLRSEYFQNNGDSV